MIDFSVVFTFLKNYPEIGYLIVFICSMIEGETIVLAASALAAIGYFSISKIVIIAFSSTLLVDQLLYFWGHSLYKKPGVSLSERFPKLYKKSKKAVILLKKYDVWFILMFRFIYGIRAISPVVIGLCGSQPKRFIPLNFLSALMWVSISCSAGYWLGDFLFDTQSGLIRSKNMHHLQYVLLGIILSIILFVVAFHLITKWYTNRKIKNAHLQNKSSNEIEKNFYTATHSDHPSNP